VIGYGPRLATMPGRCGTGEGDGRKAGRSRMDMIHYDPPLPELPLLRGLHLTGGAPRPPRVDWASFVIRLAQVMAERRDPLPPAA
jgi:hypothetical protein